MVYAETGELSSLPPAILGLLFGKNKMNVGLFLAGGLRKRSGVYKLMEELSSLMGRWSDLKIDLREQGS